jgi:hypothetical protein
VALDGTSLDRAPRKTIDGSIAVIDRSENVAETYALTHLGGRPGLHRAAVDR